MSEQIDLFAIAQTLESGQTAHVAAQISEGLAPSRGRESQR